VIKVANKIEGFGMSSSFMNTYKEVQIHGPISFKHHIEAMVIHPHDKIGCSFLNIHLNFFFS